MQYRTTKNWHQQSIIKSKNSETEALYFFFKLKFKKSFIIHWRLSYAKKIVFWHKKTWQSDRDLPKSKEEGWAGLKGCTEWGSEKKVWNRKGDWCVLWSNVLLLLVLENCWYLTLKITHLTKRYFVIISSSRLKVTFH